MRSIFAKILSWSFGTLLVAHPRVIEQIGEVVALRRSGLEATKTAAGLSVATIQEAGRTMFARIRQFFRVP